MVNQKRLLLDLRGQKWRSFLGAGAVLTSTLSFVQGFTCLPSTTRVPLARLGNHAESGRNAAHVRVRLPSQLSNRYRSLRLRAGGRGKEGREGGEGTRRRHGERNYGGRRERHRYQENEDFFLTEGRDFGSSRRGQHKPDGGPRTGRGDNRRGYFTDGRGREMNRSERYHERDSLNQSQQEQFGRAGQKRNSGRTHDGRMEEVWGCDDEEDQFISPVGNALTSEDGDQSVVDGARGESDRQMSSSAEMSSRVGPIEREHFYSVKALTDIGANEVAVNALDVLSVTRPSKIQAISYMSVLTGHHCLIADQTGSGKTLAYLAPLVQRLRLDESETNQERARPGRPRVLILAPTSELAQQVQSVAQLLSSTIPFRSCCFTGGSGRSLKTQAKLLQEGVDVLVATPGRVSTLLEAKALSLEDCRAVVLDEVDVLFMDETFKLAPIGTCAPEDTQFIFVTATLPQSVSDMVKTEFPGTKFLLGPGLHRVAPGVEEVLIDCSGPPDEPKNEETGLMRKREALLRQLERRLALRTLVFCNTIGSCRQVENMLSRASRRGEFHTLAYHSAIDPKKAAENLRQFMRSNPMSPMVMVCTDRSSRGMDFDRAEVEHVLLFDFPRDPIEYMRRVGRTARAGRKGIVTVLAWGRQVPLVREIMAGNKKGRRLLTVTE